MTDNEESSSKSMKIEEKYIKIDKDQEKIIKKMKYGPKKIIDEYLIKETIGKGTFSTVKLGEHIKTKQKVAIKILNKEKIKAKEDLVRIKREIKILQMMDHPNIIKTYKIIENEKNYFIIMEYCQGGELFNYIVDKEKLDENEASMFFYQLINALEYIHSLGIAHRDLKPENLLLIENKIIKIIDFGLSNYFNGEQNLETPCGSPSYASPEIIKGETYNGFSIDIWASGIIMFAMLCGYLPFDDDEEDEDDSSERNKSEGNNKNKNNFSTSNDESNESDNEVLFQKILEGKVDFPEYLSKDSIDLMKKILVIEPEKRIQIKDIKKHKFYLLGQKNFLLNIKNISNISEVSEFEKPKKETIKDKNNKSIINNDNTNNINIINESKDIIKNIINNINKDIFNDNKNKIKNNSSKKIKNSELTMNDIKINKANVKLKKENKKEDNNKNKQNIKDEMELYEKKLFENYLRNVNAFRKNIINKRKSANRNIEEKINGSAYRLNTINTNPAHSYINQNLKKKFPKNKINYTLNEIILDFNPNNYETHKQVTNSSNKYYYKYNNNIPAIKINPILRNNIDFPYNFNKKYKNNNSILLHNENNKSINKDSHNLLTINIPDISSKRRNHTENKLLHDIKYYITNGNYKKLDEYNKSINYLKIPKFNSIDHSNNMYRVKSNKPFLPIIKPSLFNLFSNSSINHNKDSSFLSPVTYLKTEADNTNNRKNILFNKIKNDYNRLINNTNNKLKNDFRYKLFNPNPNKYNNPF